MGLIAAGGLADHQHPAQLRPAIVLDLGHQHAADGGGPIGDGALPVGRQGVDDELMLGDFEGNDVIGQIGIARGTNWRHSMVCHLGILDCMRPRRPSYRSDELR